MKTFVHIGVLVLLAGGLYWYVFYQTPEQKLFEKTRALAIQGDPEAAYQTAGFLIRGEGSPIQPEQAAEFYRQAVAGGHTLAAWELARLYLDGKNFPVNPEESFSYLQLAARQNFVLAQAELSRFYAEGIGVAPHQGESLYWLFLAARGGDKNSREALSSLKNREPERYAEMESFLTTLQQAEKGDLPSRLEAARRYREGVLREEDLGEAFRWFSLAWKENGSARAAYALAEFYQQGIWVEQDAEKALELYGFAAEKKDPEAQYLLGSLAYQADPPNYKDAFAWFSNAAAGGHAQAQYMTGFMLLQAQGIEKSVSLAIKFFRDAALQNHVAAQYVLGQIYWKGLGVPADQKAGREWLRKAAENGNEPARLLLNS